MEIFKFMQARPAQEVSLKIELSAASPLGIWLTDNFWDKKLRVNPDKVLEKTLADKAMQLDQLVFGVRMQKFFEAIEKKAEDPAISVKWFEDTIEATLGSKVGGLAVDADFLKDEQQISDILLAAKLTNVRPTIPTEKLVTLIRAFHFVRLAADSHLGLKTREYVKAVINASVVMPSTAQLFADALVTVSAHAKARAEELRGEAAKLDSLRARANLFQAAIKDLDTAKPTDYQITRPPPPASFTYMALTAAFVASKSNIRQAAAELVLDLETTSAPDLSDKFLGALQDDMAGIRILEPDDSLLVRVGSQWLRAQDLKPTPQIDSSSTTDTMRAARPVGIADLLVVKQKIKKYEAGEVAHIENCMAGETRRRNHERTDRLEIDTFTEVETSKEEERDLQSTDKAELKQEAEQIVKSDNSVQAGMSLSASYGPVTLSTNLSSSSSTAEQDAKRQANTFSKEVVSRAVSRTMERTLVRRTEKKLFQIVETNLHEFSAKDKSATGIYQWVNKIYEAQVYNYGRRMLYEIVVPEPSAFFKQSLSGAKAEGATLVKPKPITFIPGDLNDANWYEKAAEYQIGTATPPPKQYVTAVKVYSKAGVGPNTGVPDAADIDVPEGFIALSARVRLAGSYYTGTNPSADVTVGTSLTRFTTATAEVTVYLDGQIGKIGTGFFALNFSAFTISIEVTCFRTDRALRQWQTKLFGELVTAYNSMLSVFNAELDRQRQQDEARPYGRNPLSDERIVRGELRKSALTLIRRDNFTGFDAVLDDPISGGPYPDMTKADNIARTVLFFEQAFEWEQMTYRFYEYFWGRKSQWKTDILLEDKNDQFRAFLSAGSARLVLSVRPGFEKLVANYFETGIIANAGDVPELSSPEYLPILNEIKEELNAPGTEKAYGDPWSVTVPTTLVILQNAAGQLPSF